MMPNAQGLNSAILDILPNPVLVKDAELRYVLVNSAFETLFGVRRHELYGELDATVFKDRQAVQCNGGDLRVLESGEIDEAYETVYSSDSMPRETITRKSRLTLNDGQVYLVGIMHDITEVSEANRQLRESQLLLTEQAEMLERMAYTDALTGCANRRAFYQQAPAEFAEHQNAGSLLILDIDHFKRVNDTYGHDVGDALLVHFAQVISGAICNDYPIVRLGGEEFAVALPGLEQPRGLALAERILEAVESNPLQYEEHLVKVTVSIGLVSVEPHQKLNLDDLLLEGDKCLYEAKKGGRNRVVSSA